MGKLQERIQELRVVDAAVHAYFMERFPRTIRFVDSVLEWLYDKLCALPFSALIMPLLLIVLVETRKITSIVGWCIGLAWFVAFVWIARADRVKELSVSARFIVVLVCGALLAWAGIAFGHWALGGHEPQVVAPIINEPSLAVLAKCDTVGLPITLPPHTSLSIIPVNKKRMETTKWGSYDVTNDSDKADQWPDKQAMAESARKNNLGVFAYKCEISNHSQLNVLDIEFPMEFGFSFKNGTTATVPFTPVLSPLDAGHTAFLYFVNTCPVQVTAVLPDTVSLVIVGETRKRVTNLLLPQRSIIDPIMVWFPTDVRWIMDKCD
jgi:hypothetical protein